jgi:hypothetical protein
MAVVNIQPKRELASGLLYPGIDYEYLISQTDGSHLSYGSETYSEKPQGYL